MWHRLLVVLATVAMLAVCGLSSWFIVADERQGRTTRASSAEPVPTTRPRDISSRAVDPRPLTVEEVFPAAKVVVNPKESPYRVLKSQEVATCRAAVAGDIATLLGGLGCSQVVRATLRSPTGKYLVTGGVFNLSDADGAKYASNKLKSIVDTEKGRFNGMAAGPGTEPIATSSAHVGWDIRGHYLIYCVIARADGKAFADNDPYARQILFDIVEWHLRDTVLEKRATVRIAPRGS
ncbi:MAG TPA: hypothetical protein VGJ63_21985 [Micromonosporaceae bacterium]